MASYSVADAEHSLLTLIDKALAGEEVVITRHGEPVVELRPRAARASVSLDSLYEELAARRKARGSVGITSVELLNQVYDDDMP